MTVMPEFIKEPKYTMRWLGLQTLFVLGISFVLALVANGIDDYAFGRNTSGLLLESDYKDVAQTTTYCFALEMVTLVAIMLVEVAFRKGVNYLQYGLIGCALCLFNLLLLAMTEFISFFLAYTIVSVMTIGLIALFIKGITHRMNAVWLTIGVLVCEYGLVALLIHLGTMALLVGSLSLFALIAVAMYFTLRLKLENGELVLK